MYLRCPVTKGQRCVLHEADVYFTLHECTYTCAFDLGLRFLLFALMRDKGLAREKGYACGVNDLGISCSKWFQIYISSIIRSIM